MTDKEGLNAAFDEVEADLTARPLKRGASDDRRLSADQLEYAGELLFGRNWKTEMAEAMDWRDARRVREMISGARPVPAGATCEILKLLRGRAIDCAEFADEIEAALEKGDDAAA